LYRIVAAALHTVRSQHLVIEKEAVRGADAPYNRAARERVEKRREGGETNTSYNKAVKERGRRREKRRSILHTTEKGQKMEMELTPHTMKRNNIYMIPVLAAMKRKEERKKEKEKREREERYRHDS
jgi:hypothetical protein